MSEGNGTKAGNGAKAGNGHGLLSGGLAQDLVKKGGVGGVVAIVAWLVVERITPQLEAQREKTNQIMVREFERMTDSVDRLTDSQSQSADALNESVRDLSGKLGQIGNAMVDVNARVRILEEREIPRLDRRVDRIEREDSPE